MTFIVSARTALRPDQIVDEILNVANWPGFTGWGPLPGIKEAKIIAQSDSTIGTRFAVTNTDGSTHEETVIEFAPDQRLTMRIDHFSAPLSRFAEYFVESWQFERRRDCTHIERKFELVAKGRIGKVFLALVGIALKKAVQAHTLALAAEGAES